MKYCIKEPTLCDKYNIEYSIHKCPPLLAHDIYSVFKNELEPIYGSSKKSIENEILIIPTWQKSEIDLISFDHNLSNHLDKLFLNFKDFLLNLKKNIEKKDLWIDASCPHTGFCLLGQPTNYTYNELNGLTTLLKYNSDPMGCCGIVSHPIWGSHGYPVTIFTNDREIII